MSQQAPSEFEKAAKEETGKGMLPELWGFLRHNKKWWLLPLGMVLLLVGALVALSGSAVAPFIYTLF